MIAKFIKPGNSFEGRVNYSNDKDCKDAEIVGSRGVDTSSNKSICNSLKIQAMLNPKVKNPAGHLIISFHPSDNVSEKQIRDIATEFLEKMGIANTAYVMFRHKNTSHPHLHIIYSRVNDEGKVTASDKNFAKSQAVINELMNSYDLYRGSSKIHVNRNKLRGKDKAKYHIKDVVKNATYSCDTWNEFQKHLDQNKIRMELVYDKQGVRGITFTDNKMSFSGSDIDKTASFPYLNDLLLDLDDFINNQIKEIEIRKMYQDIFSNSKHQLEDSEDSVTGVNIPASLLSAGISLIPPTSASDLGGGGVHGQLSRWDGKNIDDEKNKTNYKKRRR